MRRFLFTVFVLALGSSLAFAELVGTVSDNLLKQLVGPLESQKIDVGVPQSTAGRRPLLAELAKFPVSTSMAAAGDPFALDFNKGAFSADRAVLLAAKGAIGVPIMRGRRDFDKEWLSASRANRIFLSFSGKDIAHARSVKAALENQGYKVFIFRNSATTLNINPVETGTYFRTAGRLYVLDTRNSRASPSVNAEALAARARGSGLSLPTIRNDTRNQSEAADGPKCCQVCYIRAPSTSPYRCDPVVCDDLKCRYAR